MKKYIAGLYLLFLTGITNAADTYYISDKQYVPLRSGPNSSYRITHRGLPSGTKMTVLETNEETGYARITTARGTDGWIRKQYLMKKKPAAMQLDEITEAHAKLGREAEQLKMQLQSVSTNHQKLNTELKQTRAALKTAQAELTEITRISGNALMLDKNNQKLISDNELLKSQMELVEADNQRLRSSKENEAFFNGALAVLLGVMVTLIVPRLWPKKKRHLEWA